MIEPRLLEAARRYLVNLEIKVRACGMSQMRVALGVGGARPAESREGRV
jgi:hypothetical protein